MKQKKLHVQRPCDRTWEFCITSIPGKSPRRLKAGLALPYHKSPAPGWPGGVLGVLLSYIRQDNQKPMVLSSSNARFCGAVNSERDQALRCFFSPRLPPCSCLGLEHRCEIRGRGVGAFRRNASPPISLRKSALLPSGVAKIKNPGPSFLATVGSFMVGMNRNCF